MFHGDLVPPKYAKRTRHFKTLHDIELPSTSPGYYQHLARTPNTDYHVQVLHYKQKKNAEDIEGVAGEKRRLNLEKSMIKYDKHAEKNYLRRQIQDRVAEKIKAYEDTIEKRRIRLQELFCREEREFYYETVDKAQRGGDVRMEEMKKRAEELKAQKEAERLQVVHEKRIVQYRGRCEELRTQLTKKHLVESKNGQLQQMRENEARREKERELENMWHHLSVKEIEAKMEREEQELLSRKREEENLMEIWDKQIQAKELLKIEEKKVALEDKIEMEKLQEQLRREEIEALDNKRRKRDEIAIELRQQIEEQEKILTERKKAEDALEQMYAHLTQLEVEKERQKISDQTSVLKRETALFREHLRQLEVERKREEEELNKLVEMHGQNIQKKQEDARCKIKLAKLELQKNVLQGRAEQLEYKRQEAEQQLRLKEAENEMLRMACETNERLMAEHERSQAEAVRQYRDDLRKQIEYNNSLRQMEKEKLERQLTQGLEEEAKYRQIVEEMLQLKTEGTCKHPFRRVLEQSDCRCPQNILPN